MTPDVETKPVIFDRSRQAAEILRIGLENLGRMAMTREFVAGGQTCRSGSDDYGSMRIYRLRQKTLPVPSMVPRSAKSRRHSDPTMSRKPLNSSNRAPDDESFN